MQLISPAKSQFCYLLLLHDLVVFVSRFLNNNSSKTIKKGQTPDQHKLFYQILKYVGTDDLCEFLRCMYVNNDACIICTKGERMKHKLITVLILVTHLSTDIEKYWYTYWPPCDNLLWLLQVCHKGLKYYTVLKNTFYMMDYSNEFKIDKDCSRILLSRKNIILYSKLQVFRPFVTYVLQIRTSLL